MPWQPESGTPDIEVMYEQLAYLDYHFRTHEAPERWACPDCYRYTMARKHLMTPFAEKEKAAGAS